MKIRNGFVSNSSSSSFIVLAKLNEQDTFEKNVNRAMVYSDYEYREDAEDFVNDLKSPGYTIVSMSSVDWGEDSQRNAEKLAKNILESLDVIEYRLIWRD